MPPPEVGKASSMSTCFHAPFLKNLTQNAPASLQLGVTKHARMRCGCIATTDKAERNQQSPSAPCEICADTPPARVSIAEDASRRSAGV